MLQSGIGPQQAYHASQAVLAVDSWDLVVSSGFAGALVPCAIGTIVVGYDVLMEDTGTQLDSISLSCDERYRDCSFQIAYSLDGASQLGRIVTWPRIVGQSSEKRRIASHTKAVAIDMESAVLGRIAQNHGFPFIVVRTISDLVDEDLPLDFNLFLRPNRWVEGITQVIQSPGSLLKLPRLRRQMLVASAQLTKFFLKFFDDLESVAGRQA